MTFPCFRLAAVSVALPVFFACSTDREPVVQGEWQSLIERLEPLHTPLGKPGPDDWLATHKEPGQTFAEYQKTSPVRPIGKRKTIYVLPLGKMTARQIEIVRRTVEFMEVFFDSPVKLQEPVLLDKLPEDVERESRGFGRQLLTRYVMRKILLPKLPKDAAAYLAFTARDLWPGKGWNFLYGEADNRARVAVWSIARNGDPEKDYTQCLRRTIKTATHETGHMFSIGHCIAYECNMCGVMTMEESDRYPLALCPQCVAKVCWACTAPPRERYRDLAALCKTFGLIPERERYLKLMQALSGD